MRKVCILSLAILMSMAFVPTAPAQVPTEVQSVLCTLGADEVLPVGGTISGTHTGIANYNQPGSNPNVHVFSFCGAEGDAVDFFVDNVDTGSDLWACVTAAPNDPCDPTLYNSFLFDLGGDDERPCSVPHAFACPAGQAPLPADDGDAVYFIRVGTWSAPGGYDGTLSLNGNEVPVIPQ